jgi:hypothetical protein
MITFTLGDNFFILSSSLKKRQKPAKAFVPYNPIRSSVIFERKTNAYRTWEQLSD